MPPTSVLSDGTIRRLVERGRIRIEPWDPAMLQPASIDLRLGASFRVFASHKIPAIDLAEPPRNVTEGVEIARRRVLRHPPRRVRAGADAGACRAARRRGRANRGKELSRPPRAHRPRDGGLRRSGLPGHAHARDHQPHARADHPVAGQADRPAVVHGARPAGRAALRAPGPGQPLRRARSRRPRAATRAARAPPADVSRSPGRPGSPGCRRRSASPAPPSGAWPLGRGRGARGRRGSRRRPTGRPGAARPRPRRPSP